VCDTGQYSGGVAHHKRYAIVIITPARQHASTPANEAVAVRVSTKKSRGSVVGDFCERLDIWENKYTANENEIIQ